MNKKYLSALLFGAMTLASTGTFTSCKDYDDDIDGLSDRIEQVAKDITALQAQIQKGAVITDVKSTETGVTVTLSDGNSFTLTNGKNGVNGSVVKIGEDGFWYIDGVKTEYQAKGEKGDKGDKGEQGEQGEPGKPGQNGEMGEGSSSVYFEPGTEGEEDGFWVKVTVDAEGKKVREVTSNKWATEACEQGGVVAIYSDNALILKNVEGTNGKPVVIAFSQLESLVFVPEFILDGHEAMEYLYVPFYEMEQDEPTVTGQTTVWKDKFCDEQAALESYSLEPDYSPAEKWSYVNPYNHKPYHMNPSNAVVPELAKAANGIKMASDDLDFETRSRAYDWKYTSSNLAKAQPKGKYVTDKNGDLVIGISMKGNAIATQSYLPVLDEFDKKWENDYYYKFNNEIGNQDGLMTVLAPSAKRSAQDSITANYAAVKGSQLVVADMAYFKEYAKKHVFDSFQYDKEEAYWQGNGLVGFEKHANPYSNGYHLYSSAKNAVEKPATVELVYTNAEGINLNEMVEVHFISNSTRPWNDGYGIHPIHSTEDLAYYGLKLDFDLQELSIGPNATRQDAYATIKLENGNYFIKPCGVKSNSDTNDDAWERDESRIGMAIEGVDKTPLVRVMLRSVETDQIVKVGYIKFKITAPLNPLHTSEFELGDYFYQCNTYSTGITWHAISEKLMATDLKNYLGQAGTNVIKDKSMFDRHYRPVYKDMDNRVVKQFYMTDAKDKNGQPIFAEYKDSAYVGTIKFNENNGGETFSTFEWFMNKGDFQKVYNNKLADEDANVYPMFNVTRLVKYVPISEINGETDGDATFAKEPIYLPITLTMKYPQGVMDNKLDGYWFTENSNEVAVGSKLADLQYIHVHAETPMTDVEGNDAHKTSPLIVVDLNSVFEKNEIGYAQSNDVISSNGLPQYVTWVGQSGWEAENAPSANFTTVNPWNNGVNFADFLSENLFYRYYFPVSNKRTVKGVDNVEYKLTVDYEKVNSPVMNYGEDYEYRNTVLYANGVKIATIEHKNINQGATTGQSHAALLKIENNAVSKALINVPESWNGLTNGKDDYKMLLEALDIKIGVVAFNDCGLNFPLENNVFSAEILKPVYTEALDGMTYVDGKNGVKSIDIFDFVKFYDWRSSAVEEGLFSKNLFYYNFYGVEAMYVVPSEIQTDLSGEMLPMSQNTGNVEFKYYVGTGNDNTIPSTTVCKKVEDLRKFYGRLVYNDNRAGLSKHFNFIVPVHIKHYWSEEDLVVFVEGNTVGKTLGN